MSGFERLGQEMLRRALASNRQEFGSFFLSRLLGFEVAYGEGSCTVTFSAERPLFNPQGSLHGGVLATAMDISMGHLLQRAVGAGATLAMEIHFLAPVTGGLVHCEATFLRQGRGISFLQSHARRDDELVAHATATWKRLTGKVPPP